MKQLYLFLTLTLLTLFAQAAFNEYSVFVPQASPKDTTTTSKTPSKTKISDTRKDKPDFLKKGLKVIITPFKPSVIKSKKGTTPPAKIDTPQEEESKILSDVKVFPNPIEDQLNLSFKVNKDTNVTIKIMDVLGNEITTLLSQKLMAGEQNSSFNVASRLSSGFYFLRFVVGDEVVVKRISVL